VCEANLAGSFEKAARLLQSLAGLPLSAKRVQLITERVGGVLLKEREAATRAFLAGDCRAPRPAEPPQLLVISADGGRVQTRQADPAKKWKENKVAVVHHAAPAPEVAGVDYEGPKPIARAVTATMASWDALGDHASALAQRRGYPHAPEKVFLSDGATGIRSVRERCFPDAAFVLDWAHAVEHLQHCALALFGPGPEADRWRERQKQRLWNGKSAPLIAELAKRSRQLGPPPKQAAPNDPRRILANNLEYFRANRAGIDYPTFRRNGWPIGSGIIESSIKQIGKRLKGTEKHWTLTGAEETLQVVAHLISQDNSWQQFWQRCPLAPAA
jgi:hypothetical protein